MRGLFETAAQIVCFYFNQKLNFDNYFSLFDNYLSNSEKYTSPAIRTGNLSAPHGYSQYTGQLFLSQPDS